VAAWGRNAIPNGLRDVIAVAANLTSCLALRRDGTVVQWNNPPGAGQPDPVEQSYLARFLPPAEISNVVAVAVGGEVEPRCLAVVKGGAVVPWWQEGAPPPDNMVPPPGLSNAVAVAAGAAHSLALTAGGAVWGWGHDGSGQLSGRAAVNVARDYSGPIVLGGQPLTNAVAISAARYSNMALKRDGTVVAWGRRDSYRDVPEGLSNVVAIAAGDNFCLAITTNRQVAARFMQPR
jgi:alpha-tubulin suppressor-like RCC1 family protein